MILRVIFGIFLIVSAFILPWWISFVFSLIGLFYFNKLYEVVFVGLILDSLFWTSLSFYGFTFPFTAFMLIAFFSISKIRKNLLL